jgi:RNase P/RNase MRP subunit p29
VAGVCCGSQTRRKNIPKTPVELFNLQTGEAIAVASVHVNSKRTSSKRRAHQPADACLTDYEGETDWIRLQSKGKHHIDRMGDPIKCMHSTFLTSRDHFRKFPFHVVLSVGKISGVLQERKTKKLYYEFYNYDMYPDNPPPLGSNDYLRHSVSSMQSTNEKISGIHWTVKDTPKQTIRRRKRKTYAYLDKNGNVIEANEDGNYVDAEGKMIDTNGSYVLQQETLLETNGNIQQCDNEVDSSGSSDDDQPTPRRRTSAFKAVTRNKKNSNTQQQHYYSERESEDDETLLSTSDEEEGSICKKTHSSDDEESDDDMLTSKGKSLFNSFNKTNILKTASITKQQSSTGTSRIHGVAGGVLDTVAIRNRVLNATVTSSNSTNNTISAKKSRTLERSEELQKQAQQIKSKVVRRRR